MSDLFVISPGTGKVYRYDGSTWTTFAATPPITWPSSDPHAILFVYRGKINALVSRTSLLQDIYRLNNDGSWTAVATGIARTSYWGATGAARYRGRIYIPLFRYTSQFKMLELDGTSVTINDATGLWNDVNVISTANIMTPPGGCIKAWRERLLLGQYGQSHNTPSSITDYQEYPNSLYAFDPVAGAGVNYQKLLGGFFGDHETTIRIPNRDVTRVTREQSIYRTHLGFGVYQGKVYLMGADGGVREYLPAGTVTPTPIFSFQSAFATRGPYTAHATANPDANGLRVALSSGGNLLARELIHGMEVTCDGRTGICVGREGGTDPITWYLRDASDVVMGNFPAGASYTFKQGLGYVSGISSNFYYGNLVTSFFGEYAGVMYVLICGTLRAQLSGMRCPSILARWDGTTASFTVILHTSEWLDAAGANMHIDQPTGIMHVAYYKYLTDATVEWRHVTIDLTANPPVVTSTTSFATETWPSYVPRWGLAYDSSVLFNHDRPTAEVTNTVYDAANNKMTVTYYLYDDSSNPANVSIQTDYGTGWFEATRKGTEGEGKISLSASPSGETHTFVHDLGADGSPQVNRIQYGIVASQA